MEYLRQRFAVRSEPKPCLPPVDIPSFEIDYLIENDFLNSIPKPRILCSQINYTKSLITNDREEAKNAKIDLNKMEQ